MTHYTLEETPADTHVQELIAPYKRTYNAEMGLVLGHNEAPLFKDFPESTLGNWVTDLLVRQTEKRTGMQIDFAVVNQGGLRLTELAAGPVTRGKIYELMPFDNLVTVMEMPGSALRPFFDLMAQNGGWPVSGNVRYRIAQEKAMAIHIGGEPLDDERVYRFIIPDYVANGGDRATFFAGHARTDLDLLIRDAILHEVTQLETAGQKISAKLEGRVIEEKK